MTSHPALDPMTTSTYHLLTLTVLLLFLSLAIPPSAYAQDVPTDQGSDQGSPTERSQPVSPTQSQERMQQVISALRQIPQQPAPDSSDVLFVGRRCT